MSLQYEYPPEYNKLGAWFLGPKAENHDVLEEQFRKIVAYFKHGRESYFPSDPVCSLVLTLSTWLTMSPLTELH